MDQFGGEPVGSTGADQFGGEPVSGSTPAPPHDSSWSDLGGQFARGIGSGLTGLAGTALDAINPVRTVSRIASDTENMLQGKPIQAPQPGAAPVINNVLGDVGLNPESVQPKNWQERLAKNLGAGTTAVLMPGVGEETAAAGVLKNLALGLTGATGGDLAAEAAPDGLKGPAQMLGTLAGAGAGATAARAASGAARMAGDYTAPFTDAGRQRTAGEVIRQNAANLSPDGSIPTEQSSVPGSDWTTYQASGDPGLGQLERAVATKNPAPFKDRAADQNAARVASLQGIQSGADPNAVADFFRSHLDAVDRTTTDHVDALTQKAQQATQGLGGTDTPEGYGETLRGSLQSAESAARAHERGLWSAVDPDRNLIVNAGPIKNAATAVLDGMTPSAKPMTGEEAGIFNVASNYGDTMPFADIGDLRSRTSAAMRQELVTNGMSPTYARLSQLRGAIQNNIENNLRVKTDADNSAVSAGQMNPDDTTAARIQGWVNDFKARTANATATGQAGAGPTASVGTASDTGANGAGFYAGSGLSGSEGATGIPQAGQLFDDAAAQRLAAATAATRERAGTFGQPPVRGVLAKAGMQDLYRLPDARVPEKFFHPGPSGFTDVQALRSSIGDDKALPVLQDYAAMSLRRSAEMADGTLDPGKVASWRARHADSLRAFPELDAKFADAATASQAVADATKLKATALKEAQAGAVGRLVNATNADDVTRNVGNILGNANATQMMTDLALKARRDPNAFAGLRQAVADHITNKFIGNTEAGTSGVGTLKADQFQTFLKKSKGPLSKVFTPDEMTNLQNIADDLQRTNRSVNTKLPGQSNTAQDVIGAKNTNPKGSILSRIVMENLIPGMGYAVHGIPGAGLGWLGVKVANAFRAAGIEKVNDLLTTAMLNPDFANELLKNAPARAPGGMPALLSALRRATYVAAPVAAIGASQQQH